MGVGVWSPHGETSVSPSPHRIWRSVELAGFYGSDGTRLWKIFISRPREVGRGDGPGDCFRLATKARRDEYAALAKFLEICDFGQKDMCLLEGFYTCRPFPMRWGLREVLVGRCSLCCRVPGFTLRVNRYDMHAARSMGDRSPSCSKIRGIDWVCEVGKGEAPFLRPC